MEAHGPWLHASLLEACVRPLYRCLCEKREGGSNSLSSPWWEITFLLLKVWSLNRLCGPQDAIAKDSFYEPELKIEKGNLTKGFSEADNIVSGMAVPYSPGVWAGPGL